MWAGFPNYSLEGKGINIVINWLTRNSHLRQYMRIHFTHTRKSLARPQPRGFGLQWPLHPPGTDSSHLMNVAGTAGEKGGSTQLAPSTLGPAPAHFPIIPNPEDQPQSEGRG